MGRALGNNLINLTAYKEVKEALDENEDTILRSVPLTFHNNGSAWEMSIGEGFSEVLLGGSEDALNAFHDNE